MVDLGGGAADLRESRESLTLPRGLSTPLDLDRSEESTW